MPPKPIQPLLINFEETVSERLLQMTILLNHKGFPQIIKDQQLKSQTRRNLRLIKTNELLRISEEDKNLAEVPSLKYFSKDNVLMLEQIGIKLMSRYLHVEFISMKRGVFEDLVIMFQKYYEHINLTKKARQMTVIRNLELSEEVDFARKNMTIFVQHTRQSMLSLLNRQRNRFYNAAKQTPRQSFGRQSPEKRHNFFSVDQDQTRKRMTFQQTKKKQYSSYINQISKLLILQTFSMNNTTHFQRSQNVDCEKKISVLENTFFKKNQQVKESINDYSKQYLARIQKS